jgi:hypothetical protein
MERPAAITALTRPSAPWEHARRTAQRARQSRRKRLPHPRAGHAGPRPGQARSTTRQPAAAVQERAAATAVATTSAHHASPIIAGASGGAGQPTKGGEACARLSRPPRRSPCVASSREREPPPPCICRFQTQIRTPECGFTHNLYEEAQATRAPQTALMLQKRRPRISHRTRPKRNIRTAWLSC